MCEMVANRATSAFDLNITSIYIKIEAVVETRLGKKAEPSAGF